MAGTLQVAGTVAVSNLPATQAVSAAALPLPTGAAKESGGNLDTIAGALRTLFSSWACEGGVELRYTNRLGSGGAGENVNPNPLTIKAPTIEFPAGSGVLYQTTIGGATTYTFPANTCYDIMTDPLNIPGMFGGSSFFEYSYPATVPGGAWPVIDQQSLYAANGEGALLGTSDLTGQVIPAVDTTYYYGAIAVLGQSYAPDAVAIIGDSITNDLGQYPGGSYIDQAMAGDLPYIIIGGAGEQLTYYALSVNRLAGAMDNSGCTKLVIALGSNDFYASGTPQSLLTIQQCFQSIAGRAYEAGIRVTALSVQTRVTPSTGPFVVPGNMGYGTAFYPGATLDQYNAWLPTCQYVARFVDIRPAWQDANNKILVAPDAVLADGLTPNTASTYWNGSISTYRTVDGVHPSQNGHAVLAAYILANYGTLYEPTSFIPGVAPAYARGISFSAETFLASGPTNGQTVTSLTSTGAATMTATGSGATAPTLTLAATPSGKPALTFTSASNQKLTVPAASATAVANLFGNTGGGTIAVVYRCSGSGAGGFGRIYSKGNDGIACNNSSTVLQFVDGRATTNMSQTLPSETANAFHVVTITYDESSPAAIFYSLGLNVGVSVPNASISAITAVGAGAFSDDGSQDLVIGNNSAGNRAGSFDIAEIVNVPGPVSANENIRLHSFLRAKHGIKAA